MLCLHTVVLSPLYATTDKDCFKSLESTNAVEAYNWLSKNGKVLLPLSVYTPHLPVQEGHDGNSSIPSRN